METRWSLFKTYQLSAAHELIRMKNTEQVNAVFIDLFLHVCTMPVSRSRAAGADDVWSRDVDMISLPVITIAVLF